MVTRIRGEGVFTLPSPPYGVEMNYSDFIQSTFTIFNGGDYKVESWIKNRFEFIVCDNRYESSKKFAIGQLLDTTLWEIPNAVDLGFVKWKKINLPLRLEAIKFHRENCNSRRNCKMCKLEKQWSDFNERTRPELC